MPTEKRARQRAARMQKQAEVQRHRKRRQLGKRTLLALVILAVIIGLVVLLSTGGKKKPTAAGTTTTTTTASAPTSTFATPTTQPLNTTAAAPVCPSASETKRIVWFKAAPPNCIPPTSVWDATFDTSVGPFTVRMDAASSYKAVNNFVFLARWHYYDGTFFHRVIKGFVDQGGDPAGTGTGQVPAKGKVPAHSVPGYAFTGNTPPASCAAKKDCYPAGSFAMANSGTPTTNGSQFFVVVPGGTARLTHPLYTLLGTVTSGMSVVDKINSYGAGLSSATGAPRVTVYVLKVVLKQVTS